VVNPTAIVFFQLVLVFLLGMLIEALILQAACALFNLLAGASGPSPTRPIRRAAQDESDLARTPQSQSITTEPGAAKPDLEQGILVSEPDHVEDESLPAYRGVPKPGLDRAMRIVFVAALVNVGASFIILRVLRLMGLAGGIVAPGSVPLNLVSSPLYFLVLSGLNAVMLPTSFGKGLLIGLIFVVLTCLLILALFVCLVIAHSFGLSLPRLL
jgi:hypothetical protein